MPARSTSTALCTLLAATLLSHGQQTAESATHNDSDYYDHYSRETAELRIAGQSLEAFSVTLRNCAIYDSSIRINDDYNAQDGTQTVSLTTPQVTAYETISQIFGTSGYLIDISDADEGEESFLILALEGLTLTVQTGFDLLDSARSIPADASATIRRAHTLESVFGSGARAQLGVEDRVFLWDGTGWIMCFLDGNRDWRRIGSFFKANDVILYPDEGFFVLRNHPADLTIRYSGERPRRPQITTMAGPGLHFVGMRYPQDVSVGQLGFENLPGWTVNDRVYAWNGNQWVMYFYAFDNKWHKIGSFFPAGEDVVAGHTAVFVHRTSGGTAQNSGNKHVLPTDYDWR